jgi:hypothetical protein
LILLHAEEKEVAQRSPKYHPDTHIIPEDLAAKMEAYIDSVYNTSKNEMRRKHKVQDVEEEEDGYEHKELLLPHSVLHGYGASSKLQMRSTRKQAPSSSKTPG